MKRQKGFVLPLAVVIILPLMGLVALVVDAGRAWYYRQVLEQAADAAAIAAVARLPLPATIETYAEDVFRANVAGLPSPPSFSIVVDNPGAKVSVAAAISSPAAFSMVLGFDELDIGVRTAAARIGVSSPYSYRLVPAF